ncbi:MAG: superoxide dismutase [Actinomycetota bacterium]|nr:superoxide dismutase [Actinomycetota bacterium]
MVVFSIDPTCPATVKELLIHATTTGVNRRRILPGILVLALSLPLAACGGGETGGGKEDTGGKGETTQQAAASSTESYVLPGEEVYPEGITYRPETGEFFVGSTTDGTVFRGIVGGGEAETFLEPGGDGRSTAVGMKVDDQGRLFIAGGDTGGIFVYRSDTGDLIRALETPESEMAFINDVTVTPNGDAYFTDSMRPTLFRVPSTPDGEVGEAETWLDFEGTPIEYQEGFNLNGIVASEDGRYLIVTQSNTGNLYRIDTQSREVTQIDLGGETVQGDGMLLDGLTLYAVRGQDGTIVPVELSEDFASGEVGEEFADPSFARPTTIAKYDNRLLVVNSQFDRRQSGESPELPFTVSDIAIP